MNSIMQAFISRKCAGVLWKPFRRTIHVRVRFAPSPTGYLHLGGLRTAVYNYLFAKKYNGKFILRIEDTDQSRLVSDATASLVEDLNWSGIEVDEGPTFGGSYGPYIQSQRLHIYNDGVDELLNNKSAYRCFCTEGRLDMLRKEALKRRQVPKYDNKCRNITPYEINEKLLKRIPFCIRLKMSNYSDPIMDLIYGNINTIATDSEGDPIIVKSDGYPTYHLANVVDDHMMKITHVFRGVEWQTSTIKHLLLYRAFGWNPPEYGHLPLLVNADGTKLSKRQGDISIKQFRERGIFPNALVNYVTSAGGGFERDEFKRPRIQTLTSLFKKFDIQNLTSRPSKLNPDLLNEFNNLEILRRLSHEKESDELVEEVRRIVVFKYSEKHAAEPKNSYIRKVLYWAAKRITTLSELTSEKFMFLWVDCDPILTNRMTKNQILELITVLEKIDFAKNDINQALKSYSKMAPMRFADLMQILRRALSGLKDGPGVVEIMEILGKETSLSRIRSNLKSNK